LKHFAAPPVKGDAAAGEGRGRAFDPHALD
jgi:hypothetical protein